MIYKRILIILGGVKLSDLRGKLKLTTTATLLRKMDYFIGSCSAPLHIAAAVGCPSMAFYGPTSPKKWAPLHKCKYIFHKHPCNPCDRRVCQELCVKKFSRLHHSAS
ncbi:hypothetical protein I6E26_08575 [Anaerovibrio lipolyticus]|nr:hypothetical protein [Anaerovibrio lipolyticus]